MESNICSLTDAYKFGHWPQYPPKTTGVFSYFESRTGAKFRETELLGLQAILKEYLVGPVVSLKKIDEANAICNAVMGKGIFNRASWIRMLDKYHGRLPIRIRAVPEGTPVPVSNVLMTVENTDPEFYWLTNYLETLLVQVWYASTVATQSREMKKTILKWLKLTGDPAGIDYKLHDFGFRGASSVESAGMGGMAHLVNFKGTDTIRGLEYAMAYYNSGYCAGSIPASEHSTITSWGRDHEVEAMANMLEKYPTGFVACVSDSWDVFNAAANIWGGVLKDKVLAREGCLVVRPDSGDPLKVVPEVMRLLGQHLGQEKNAKGYFVLNPKVRMIQGDGITADSLDGILRAVADAGYSADNIAFGSGGGLLQKVDRDTQRFAFKCSAIQIDGGQWKDVYKQPLTDGSKASKGGRIELYLDASGHFVTARAGSDPVHLSSMMRTVFENGELLVDDSFDLIRKRSEIEVGEMVKI